MEYKWKAGHSENLTEFLKDYRRKLWTTVHLKLDNLDEMDGFLEMHKLSKLTLEAMEKSHRPIKIKEKQVLRHIAINEVT